MVVKIPGLGLGPVVVVGFHRRNWAFEFKFVCVCGSVMFSIIVDKHS